jgi:3-keto-5-aminohexanoate cleavage enzyme
VYHGAMNLVVIEVAMNGETPKSRNPHVPRSAAEIAADGIATIREGAAVLHNHIHDPFLTGSAAADAYGRGWCGILERHPDALLCPTMAAGANESARIAHFDRCSNTYGARLAPLDPGSMNMPLSGGEPGKARMLSYVNSMDSIESFLAEMRRLNLAASMGIYEPGFLRAAVAFQRAGKLPKGSVAKLYFFGGRNYFDGTSCIGFGLSPTAAALDAYLEIIGDSGLPWAAAVVGGCVFESGMAKLAVERGGHVRVGLEDYAGGRSPSNLELLREVVGLARSMGREPATPGQARHLLGLPP